MRRTLDTELEAVLLSKAAQFGLPAEWVSRLDKLDPERRQVLRVRNCVALSHAALVLKSGDMVSVSCTPRMPVDNTCFVDMHAGMESMVPRLACLPAAPISCPPPACTTLCARAVPYGRGLTTPVLLACIAVHGRCWPWPGGR